MINHNAPMVLLAGGLLCLGPAGTVCAQQRVDSLFRVHVAAPTWPRGTGPVVVFDQAHNDLHTIDGEYRPFADLLRADGFRIRSLDHRITRPMLDGGSVLVIVDALASASVDHWINPTLPAFDSAEERTIVDWVRDGGSLLLVADHMPFPGATERLARRFGIMFTNGFATDTLTWDPIVFRRSDGSLASHPITDGRIAAERIDSVATFDGQGFRFVDSGVRGLMTFREGVVSYNPDTAWAFPHPWVPTESMQGWSQGAAMSFGKGRVLILGEAGMLSAQVSGPKRVPLGMNAPVAGQNQQFVLNALHWLAGLLGP
jgi:hypothetical protein